MQQAKLLMIICTALLLISPGPAQYPPPLSTFNDGTGQAEGGWTRVVKAAMLGGSEETGGSRVCVLVGRGLTRGGVMVLGIRDWLSA